MTDILDEILNEERLAALLKSALHTSFQEMEVSAFPRQARAIIADLKPRIKAGILQDRRCAQQINEGFDVWWKVNAWYEDERVKDGHCEAIARAAWAYAAFFPDVDPLNIDNRKKLDERRKE